MTREETIAFIREELVSTKSFENFCERLRALPGTLVFEAFFPIAVREQWHGPALGAASVLFVVRPECPLSCKDAIRALLEDWAPSIEEVPWYLADCFGKEVTLKVIEELSSEPLSKRQRTYLDTVQYWVDIYFGFTPEKARERRLLTSRYF
jgi:hypothetical protein